MTDYLLFGLWTLLCVTAGAWLMHRKQQSAPPLPDFYDANKMFNWIRTGKAEPQDGAVPPPIDAPDEKPPGVNWEL